MSALGAAPEPVAGPTRGAGDPAAATILMHMTELAHQFVSSDPDPEDKQAMSDIIQALAIISQKESTETAPGPSKMVGGPQGLGGPFENALAQRGMMGGQ
jgi:hypothetical protein